MIIFEIIKGHQDAFMYAIVHIKRSYRKLNLKKGLYDISRKNKSKIIKDEKRQ